MPMSTRSLFGVRTRYTVAGFAGPARVPQAEVRCAFLEGARARFAHLPDSSSPMPGLFLENGGRVRWPAGGSLEFDTPETTDPLMLVAEVRAGDAIVRAVFDHLAATRQDWTEIVVSRYVARRGAAALRVSEESYLLRGGAPRRADRHLIPFLASRVVCTGVGGDDACAPRASFRLSPHAWCEADETDAWVPAVVPRRVKPLSCTPFQRLRVVDGEMPVTDAALLLRTGATALVLRLIEQRIPVGRDMALADPRAAARMFGADPTCRRTAPLVNGKDACAVAIQRVYLEAVERRVGLAPAWAGLICEVWRSVLDHLERPDGWQQLVGVLDWPTKLACFIRFAERHGAAWPDLPAALRTRVGEIDVRWGDLTERGIVQALDAAGVVKRWVSRDDIAKAIERPPHDTRAAARGHAVRAAGERRDRCECSWVAVHDFAAGDWIDLRDPFQRTGEWALARRMSQV